MPLFASLISNGQWRDLLELSPFRLLHKGARASLQAAEADSAKSWPPCRGEEQSWLQELKTEERQS